jgi:hypothetical protein
MIVVDLKTQDYGSLWENTVSYISGGNDPLKNNYLNINLNDFISFTCVVQDDKIICFSGLQYDTTKWGAGIARCSSRMWIHPHYRFTGGTRFTGGPRFLNSYYCIPQQIRVARERNIGVLFVSREDNRSAFGEYLSLLEINTGQKFSLFDEKYWVCGPVRDHSCLQHVGVGYLNDSGPGLWQNQMRQFADISV